MNTDRDDAAARRYREASAVLDERPSAETRAAILAAAARQVEARPGSADAPRVARRPRWPLAAAAAVLLSTLAVMMANRTGEEMPSFTAPAEQAPAPVAVAPATAVAPPPPSESAVPMPAPPLAQAPASLAKRSTTDNARDERSSIPAERVDAQRLDAARPEAAARPAERAPGAASAEARQEFAAPPPAAPLARPDTPPAAAGAMRAPDTAAASPAASSRERAAAREAAPAAQGAARLDAARDFEGSAPRWLERIVQLRREGRDAEADAELKRFRERYPEVPVPPAALAGAAAGTR